MEVSTEARSSKLDSAGCRTAGRTVPARIRNAGNFHLSGACGNTAAENDIGELSGGGARGDEFVFFDFGGDPGLALIL